MKFSSSTEVRSGSGAPPLRITRAFLAGMDEAAPQETQIVHVADRCIGF